jgi:hypothetical protein
MSHAWEEGDFVGKGRRKEPLGRPRPRWEVNSKMDLTEIE